MKFVRDAIVAVIFFALFFAAVYSDWKQRHEDQACRAFGGTIVIDKVTGLHGCTK
jgi:hypothetical protein